MPKRKRKTTKINSSGFAVTGANLSSIGQEKLDAAIADFGENSEYAKYEDDKPPHKRKRGRRPSSDVEPASDDETTIGRTTPPHPTTAHAPPPRPYQPYSPNPSVFSHHLFWQSNPVPHQPYQNKYQSTSKINIEFA